MVRIKAAFLDVIDRYQFYLCYDPNRQKTDYYDLEEVGGSNVRQLLNEYEDCFFKEGYLIINRPLTEAEKEKEQQQILNIKKSCVNQLQRWINHSSDYAIQIKEYLEYKQIIIEGLVFPV